MTQSIRSAFTAAICEFATHRRAAESRHNVRETRKVRRTGASVAARASEGTRCAGCSIARRAASPCQPTSVRTMIRCTGFISGRRTCESSTSGKSRRCIRPALHPVVERLIGTVQRECLDRLVFWTAADLERKLLEFQHYYNEHRDAAGRPPAPGRGRRSGESPGLSVAATLSWAV